MLLLIEKNRGIILDHKIILSVLSLIFFLGCVSGPVCNKPYIQVGNNCCIDRNDNRICDTEDTTTTSSTTTTILTMQPLPDYINSQCSGKLLVVYADRIWLYTGEPVKITASFKNAGKISDIPIVFKFKAMLDDSIDSVAESDKVMSNSGETTDLTVNLVPSKPGRYIISATVDYCERTSEERSTTLNVRDILDKPTTETLVKNETTEKKKWTITS